MKVSGIFLIFLVLKLRRDLGALIVFMKGVAELGEGDVLVFHMI